MSSSLLQSSTIPTLADKLAERVLGPGEVPYYLRPNEDVGLPALPASDRGVIEERDVTPPPAPMPVTAAPRSGMGGMFWLIAAVAVGGFYLSRTPAAGGTKAAPKRKATKRKATKRKAPARRKAGARRKTVRRSRR